MSSKPHCGAARSNLTPTTCCDRCPCSERIVCGCQNAADAIGPELPSAAQFIAAGRLPQSCHSRHRAALPRVAGSPWRGRVDVPGPMLLLKLEDLFGYFWDRLKV